MDLRERAKVRMMIQGCKLCDLHKVGSGGVPFSGPMTEPRLVVVGEAPGSKEDTLRTPFVGPSGQLARSWLRNAGMEDALDVAFMNVVSCFPNRTPTTREVTACAVNVQSQFDLLRPRYVLVLGGVALSALCPVKTRISEAAGYPWKFTPSGWTTSVWAMATYHPSAVLRNRSLEEKALEDVETIVLMCKEEMEPADHAFCMKCKKKDVVVYHECGLGFCQDCRRLVGV